MEPEGGLLGQAEKSPQQIRAVYDDWARAYDGDITTWGYEAPKVCADYLSALVAKEARVLDAGCGTGLVGKALAAAGFNHIVGIDFSGPSLELARATGAYEALHQVDLTKLPMDLADGEFSALVCVGVMSYLPDIEATCREFCRLVTPGAPVLLTQRGDLFRSRHTQRTFDALIADGTWELLELTPERDYLPANPEFAEIGVRYCMFRCL